LEANLESGISIAIEKSARIHHLGKMSNLPVDIQNKIKEAIRITADNKSINIILAFNYGGRDEMVEATKKIVAAGIKPENINEDTIGMNLYSAGIPDPDLIIRTAGEMRLSNFLLWQSAYAEIYFTSVLWPDFDKKELDKALKSYGTRKRRFGSIDDEGLIL
jgi:undecaprenyl diphosphate synthase